MIVQPQSQVVEALLEECENHSQDGYTDTSSHTDGGSWGDQHNDGGSHSDAWDDRADH